jgi:uncharacterized protein (DUF433 family)
MDLGVFVPLPSGYGHATFGLSQWPANACFKLKGSGRLEMPHGDRIVVDPGVLVGKPIIKGTRLAVEFIIELMANGWSHEDILHNYPGLTTEDILACLSYAGALLHAERVYPLELNP